MRRSPITVGVLAAELAIGALVLAPPAGADDDPVPTDPPVDVPLPVPEVPVPSVPVPSVVVRTGRTGDPNAVTPVADDTDDEPPADSTPPAPPAPGPEPEPSPEPEAPNPTSGADVPASASVPDGATPTPPPAPAASALPLHTVVDGDNLWSIAAAHLASTTGRDVASIPVAELALYWVRVCDANAPTLASGDLDVIYPGELIALPPV